MQWIPPTSDTTRLELLHSLRGQLHAPNLALEILSAAQLAALDHLIEAFDEALPDLIAAREAHSHLLRQCKEQEQQLRFLLRDAYQLVRRQRRKPSFPSSLFEAFGLTREGKQTAMSHHLKAPIEIAQTLITANASAQQRGFQILTDPTPQTLADAAQKLADLKARLAEERNHERYALAQMRNLRQQTQHMFIRIRTAIKLASIGQPPQQQQQLLQEMGFDYRHKTKEVPAPIPPPSQAEPPHQGSGRLQPAEAQSHTHANKEATISPQYQEERQCHSTGRLQSAEAQSHTQANKESPISPPGQAENRCGEMHLTGVVKCI